MRRHSSGRDGLLAGLLFGSIAVACNTLSGASDLEISRSEDPLLPDGAPSGDTDGGAPRETGTPGLDRDANVPGEDGDVGDVTKIVFVTEGSWPASIKGVDGAKALCVLAAEHGGLPSNMTWVPWLSTSSTNAIARIRHEGRYALLDGTIIVSSKAQLASGKLDAPIDVTESKTKAPTTNEGARVWTGTRADGNSATPDDCSGFTTANTLDFGTMGSSKQSGPGWTKAAGAIELAGGWGCQTKGHVYCFEE